ncbi:MAG: HAMP domain-containing protein [Candidatus Omnitrophica bacterium]|nr:HAMP domain-containing protein [Candidatus Omnitrophota bacterium]
MRSVTLKTRIIVILTVITIITIGIFVVIQLSHEMESVHRYLKYKAQSDSGTIKDVFNQIVNSDLDKDGKKDAFIKIFRSLKQEKYVQKGYILDLDGQIIAGTEPRLESTAGNYEDSIIIQKAYRAKRMDREPIIDKKNRLFSIYLPLGDEDVPLFVAKLYFSLGDVWGALSRVYVPAITVGFLLIIVNIILGMVLSRLIVRPIAIFNQAAKKIASGQLHLKVTIPTNDELEELADSFNFMTQELVRMKKIAENANPLTKLPGNLVIMEEVEGRIKRKEKFTVVYSDLDHFKAFNDK